MEKYSTDYSAPLSEEKKLEIKSRIDEIKKNMQIAKSKSPYNQDAKLLLATKTRTVEEINFALSLGVDAIGENRVQELCEKYDRIEKGKSEIHFIGALQTNKVKQIIDKVQLIHSVDRLSLAKEIDRQAAKLGIVMNVLCEVNIGDEESKSGLAYDEVIPFLSEIAKFEHIKVCGLMAIPPIMQNISTQKQYFQKITNLYIDILAKKIDNISMSVLSFGMSSDYEPAIECGSTIVRIGTAAFGSRN